MPRSQRLAQKSVRSRSRSFSSRFPVLEPLETRRLLSAAVTFTNVGVGGGGGMYKPRISPFNPQDVYISSDQGDLFYSSNFGQSWTTVNFQEARGGQDNPIQFTNNSSILYAVENDVPVKSSDGGITWNAMPGWTVSGSPDHVQVQSDLTNSNIVFASTANDKGTGYAIYESTNGGANFTALTGLTYASGAQAYIAGEFNNGTNIFLGTSAGLLVLNETTTSWTPGPSGGIPGGYAMVSMTGAISGGVTRLAAVVTPSSMVFANIDSINTRDSSGVPFVYDDMAPFTLDYGGTNTWVQKNTTFFGSTTTHIGEFADYIQMVNGDINTLIATGGAKTSSSTIVGIVGVQVYKSTDGGTTWAALMSLPAGNVSVGSSTDLGAADGGAAQGIGLDTANANYIMVSNNVGDWATTNGGTQWTEVSDSPASLQTVVSPNTPVKNAPYSSTLNPTSVWGLTFIDQQHILANFTDITGVYSTDGGNTWTYPTYPTSINTIYNTSYDPRTQTLWGAFSQEHDMFTQAQYADDVNISGKGGFIMFSTNGGATWTEVTQSFANDPVVNILVDPNVANKAYALVSGAVSGEGGVYYTTDLNDGASSVWQPLPGGDPTGSDYHPWDIQELSNGNLLVTYGPNWDESLNGGHGDLDSNSSLFLWNASTSTWTNLLQCYGSGDAHNLQQNVRDVTVDPNDPSGNTLYLSISEMSGYFGTPGVASTHPNSGVWKTTNGGTTWTQLFALDGASSTTINKATGEMYVATDSSGVWYTSDVYATTPTFQQLAGEPFGFATNVYIDPFNPNQVWVTTFGDGVLVGNTTAPGLPGTPTNLAAETLSSTQVKLTWADNDLPAPQGYIVDVSTDQLTWTAVDTVNSGDDLSAIIGGLTANTSYYFRVIATSSAGDSIPGNLVDAGNRAISVRTDSSTGLLAYDGFNDSSVGGALSGTNGSGGTGWATSWSGTSGLPTIVCGSLTVTNPGGTLAPNTDTTNDNSINLTHDDDGATRTLTDSVGSVGTDFWASVLMNVTSGGATVTIGNLNFGINSSGKFYMIANGLNVGNANVSASTGQTYLLVVRVDNEVDSQNNSVQTFAMWADPVIGATAPDYSTSVIGPGLVTNGSDYFGGTTNAVSFTQGAYSNQTEIDEIRIGTTYASVVPVGTPPAVPTTPSGLAATVASTSEIDLTWTALASDQKGFHIQYSTNGTSYTTLDTIYDPSATSYAATGLSAGTQYWFRVTGFNDAGDSTVSSAVNKTTLISAPSQPTSLLAVTTPASSTSVNLTWNDNATNESGYNVYYTTNARDSYGMPTWTLFTTTPLIANRTSDTVTGLDTNTFYYFKVSAVNTTAETFSAITSVQTIAAPTTLVATAANSGQVDLTWDNNTAFNSGFKVEYSTDDVSWTTFTPPSTYVPTINTLAVTGLASNTEYYFRVSATATNSQSLYTNTAIGRTLATNSNLIAAEDFSYSAGTNLTGENAGIGWATPWSFVTGGNGPSNAQAASGSLSAASPANTLLTSGNQVTEIESLESSRTTTSSFGGNGTQTWVSFLITPSTLGGSIVLGNAQIGVSTGFNWGILIPGTGGAYMNSSASVTAGITYFVVAEINKTSGGAETYQMWVNPTPGATSPGSGAAISLTNSTGDYNFNASHSLELTTGGYSKTAAVRYDEVRIGTSYEAVAPIPAPAAPTGLSATAVSSSQINLSWTNASGSTQTGLHIQRSTDGVTFTTIDTIATPTTTIFSDTSGLSSGTLYYYRVTGFNDTGDSLYAAASATSLANIPTSLAATAASSSQINLTWSESGTATSYNIYRAPDVSGSPGAFTLDNASTTTSFSDTGLSATTKYWYEVTAVNSASVESADSTQANATTSAASAAIASDSFNYSAGGLNGDGTSGSGWAGGWTATSPITVSTTSLTPPGDLATSGGSISTTQAGYSASRNLSANLNTNGTTVWGSVLIKPNTVNNGNNYQGGFTLGNVQVNYMHESDGNWHWNLLGTNGWYGTNFNSLSNPVATSGTTYFVVIEEVFNGGSDTVYAWINPTTGSTAPSTGSAFSTQTGVNAGGSTSVVKLTSDYFANTSFDEVRIGTTYGAVAPVPIPADPSALSATAASSSQINLTWTDNSSDETGFKVYQSTDGTTFSLIQTIATANTIIYNVTGLSSATQYWYKVTAYNAAGESGYSNAATAMTAIAGGIASDSFTYSAGGLNGDGTSGSGWAGGWTATSPITVSTIGLTPPGNLATSGGSISTTQAGYSATRNLSSNLNTNGTTIWGSVLIKPNTVSNGNNYQGGFTLGNVQVNYMHESDGNWHWNLLGTNGWYGTNFNSLSNPVATSGTTYFVVIEEVFNGGSDTVYAWINPTTGSTAPSTGSAFSTQTGVNAGGSTAVVKLTSDYYANTSFDEVRIGTTYAFVAPPQISGLTINSTHSSSYSIHNRSLATGVSQYGDVTENFTTIPSAYQGLTYIQTAEADSTSTASNLITFTVYQPTVVYVVFDDAITTKPTWLTSQFTDTGDNIISAEGTFSVYKMTVSAGLVTLGGPGGTSGQGMYSVLLGSP